MREHGAPDVVVDGEVLEADPPRKLVQTWRMVMDPAMEAEGVHAPDLRDRRAPGRDVTPDRRPRPHRRAGARRRCMRGDMEAQGAGGGWSWVLSTLKTLLETGEELGQR